MKIAQTIVKTGLVIIGISVASYSVSELFRS